MGCSVFCNSNADDCKSDINVFTLDKIDIRNRSEPH